MSDQILEKLINMTDVHERRLNHFDIWKEQISGELKAVIKSLEDNRLSQDRTCETMVRTREEVVAMLNGITAQQNQMQKDQIQIQTIMQVDRDNRLEKKGDKQWVASFLIAIPQLLITMAIIFAALQLQAK